MHLRYCRLYSFSAMVILSSCSFTKRAPVDPQLTVSTIRERRLAPFAQEWAKRVNAATLVAQAANLYGGPGVSSALAAARRLGCPSYFVSAGLSLVSSHRWVPSYNLSVSQEASCPPAVARGEASAADWWESLNDELGRPQPIASLVRRSAGPVLIALPEHYVSMVSRDLISLSPFQREKLRLIVAGKTRVPRELEPYALRYDERLAGLPTAPGGANSYFPQRALRHFAELLSGDRLDEADVLTHRHWVEAALAKAKPVDVPKRTVQTDVEVLCWIKNTDPGSTRSVAPLLRAFREAGRACEQNRFRRLVEESRGPS